MEGGGWTKTVFRGGKDNKTLQKLNHIIHFTKVSEIQTQKFGFQTHFEKSVRTPNFGFQFQTLSEIRTVCKLKCY